MTNVKSQLLDILEERWALHKGYGRRGGPHCCLHGAIVQVMDQDPQRSGFLVPSNELKALPEYELVLAALLDAADRTPVTRNVAGMGLALEAWNDFPTRTKNEVLEVVRRAEL